MLRRTVRVGDARSLLSSADLNSSSVDTWDSDMRGSDRLVGMQGGAGQGESRGVERGVWGPSRAPLEEPESPQQRSAASRVGWIAEGSRVAFRRMLRCDDCTASGLPSQQDMMPGWAALLCQPLRGWVMCWLLYTSVLEPSGTSSSRSSGDSYCSTSRKTPASLQSRMLVSKRHDEACANRR